MKKIGYILIWAAFLAASLVAVLEVQALNWMLFVPFVLVGFIGVAMVRIATKSHAEAAHRVEANIQTIHSSLEKIVAKVGQLNQDRKRIDTYDMRHKIDDMVLEDLDDFIEARETIGTKYGLQHYADVMSHFAAGERYLNRVWSASADGWVDEVNEWIGRAEEQFKEAFDQLKRLEATGR